MLRERGVRPEALPAVEDIGKLKRKIESEEKKVLKDVNKNSREKNP